MAASVAVVFATSCAAIIHPERKGNNAAPVDTVPLVVDILLFLPGVIPGVIAMVVDFGTGAIFLNKDGSSKPFLAKRGRAEQRKLMVEVVDADGTVLQRRALQVDPPRRDEPVALSLPDLASAEFEGRDVHLRIATANGEPVSVPAR